MKLSGSAEKVRGRGQSVRLLEAAGRRRGWWGEGARAGAEPERPVRPRSHRKGFDLYLQGTGNHGKGFKQWCDMIRFTF